MTMNALSRDDILSSEDVRYYMLPDGQENMQGLEMAVVENPTNVHMLINLAYKKLHEDIGFVN